MVVDLLLQGDVLRKIDTKQTTKHTILLIKNWNFGLSGVWLQDLLVLCSEKLEVVKQMFEVWAGTLF